MLLRTPLHFSPQFARITRLALLLLGCALCATSASKQTPTVAWLEHGLRPSLFNRGTPLSPAFQAYLNAHFSPDPRRLPPRPPYPIVTQPRAKNCILLIGDGMGLAHVCAAGLAAYGAGGRLAIQRMPIVGQIATYSSSSLITDSGAAATALSTGFRTYNGAVAVDPWGQPLESYLATAKRHGKRTGVVVTSSLTDGTPACFVANVVWRSMQAEIAAQMLERDFNVLLGAGLAYFIPESHPSRYSVRSDERDLLSEAIARSYQFTLNPQELPLLRADHVLGMFGLFAMPPSEAAQPSLVEMTSKALELLSRGNGGFCLMVEGSQIDWRAHAGDFEGLLRDVLEFDRAVGCCLQFAAANGDTLVLVTADHETGGLALPGRDNASLSAYWGSGYHTAIMVPLWAYGPGCMQFVGVYENIDIPVKIATVLGLDDFPALRARLAENAPNADTVNEKRDGVKQ
jgi:alkaline phosphatase